MRILVTGATGTIGRRTSAELARSGRVDELILSARDRGSADKLARIFGGQTGAVRSAELDVADRSALVRAAKDADVVVGCAGPYHLLELDSIRAAIEAGSSYVSLNDDHSAASRARELDEAALDADVTIVSGCGMSPGVTNLLVALAAAQLGAVDEIEIALGVSSADAVGDASTLHFAHAMASDAPSISDRGVAVERAATAPKLVYFPEPLGWVETFRTGHPEVVTMPDLYPNLGALSVRIGLTERIAMDVVRASATTGLLSSEKRRRTWLRVTQPLRPMIEALPPRGAPWTGARVDVRGRTDGRSDGVALAVVDRITNLAAVPLARAALTLGSEPLRRGVRSPEELFDPADFLKGMASRGIRVARLEPEMV